MRIWKRLLGTALCLCAAVCVMSVSASAAGTVIPAVDWEQQTRSTEYGKPITTHGFQVTEWYTAKYDYTGTWYRCEDLNKKNPTAVGELVLEDSVPELYYIPNDLEAGVYYYYLEVTAKDKGTNTIVETNWSPVNTVTVKPSVPKVDKDWPTVGPLQCGQTLSESAITGGTMVNKYTNAKVEGTFAWKDGSRVLTTKDTGRFDIVLSPSDTKNYKPGSIRMSVRVAHVTDKEGTITTAPTCTNQGWRSFTCSGCGTTYSSRPIPALDHDYTVQQSDGDNHWKKCSRCDATDTPKAHQWDEGEVTTAATCTTAGEKTYTCTVCNRTKTETLAALEHNYGEPAYVWNGKSCTAERVCSRDGSHKETETVTAAVTVTQNRSCLLDELSTYTASFKNAAFTKQTQENVVTANKLGHDFENGTWQSDGDHHWKKCSRCDVTDEASKAPHSGGTATCQAKAVCETCGTAYGALDANNHSGVLGVWQSNENNHWKEYSCCNVHADVGSHHWDEGRETKSPTCTEAGVKTFTCSQCNNAKTKPIPALDHQWSEWVVTTPATETTEGSETRTCQRDNTHTETRSIPKLNHTHTMVHHSAVDADCGKGTPGNIEYWVCSGCKKVFSDKDGAHEINLENTVIPPDHNPSTAWSFDESSHWYECKKCKEKLDFAAHDYDDDIDTDCNICNYTRVIIPPHSHVLEQVPAVPATCVSAGNTEHYRCAACGERFKDGGGNEPVTEDAVKIPPLGHDWQEASCETPKFCKRDGCGVTDGAALGHDWGRYIVTMAATQESEGVETRTCQRNSNHTQTRPIPKLPASTYGVSGEVNESGGNPAVGAVVKLVLGDRQIASTTTDDKGKYSFEKVVPGVYNLVAEKDDIIMTVKVTVISKDVRVSTITMPQGKTNSVVEVKSDDSAETVEAVVGNLEKVFERPGNDKPFTVEDQTVVDGGGSVEIKLTVTKTDEDETSAAIRQELPANTKVGVRLELGVDKTVTPKNGSPQSTPVNNTDILLETMIRLPAALQGKDSYTVYRLHGRDVHALTAQKNTDGEFIEVSHDRTAITIHAKLYSEYVIAYQERGETGGNGGNTGGNGGNGGNGNGGGHDDNDDGYTPPSVPARPETHTGYRACRRDDTCPIWPFADAAPTAWYHDGVHYCVEKGLMHGISADKFLPDGSVTRAQLAAILWRLEGNPAPVSTADFSDVADGAWYAGAVRWAADNGVVKGYADGRFHPNDAVTREQMATLLYRFAEYKGYDVSIGGDTDILCFTDGAAIGGYAVPAMRWACGSGLMTGTQRDGGMALAPRDTTTRAQTATLLTRFQSTFAKEP